MYNVTYHRASSVEDAAKLAAGAAEAKFVLGGQTLIPAMKQRLAAPSDLIDLRHIAAMKGVTDSGGGIIIGAATTHAEVASNADLQAACPALCHLAAHIGDPHVRHMGTIGGSIANNDPAADYPAGVLGLGATIVTTQRSLGADEFFTGMYETALKPGELIKSVSFPVPKRAGYAKFANPASRFALIGVFVSQAASGAVRVAVTGAGNGVFRSAELEKALAASFTPDAAGAVKVPAGSCNGDIHASAEYRAHLVSVMAKRAVAAALG